MNRTNRFYGHNQILAAYVGLDGPAPPIWGYLQHGWQTGYGFPADHRLIPWFPKFVWNQRNVEGAVAAGVPRAVPTGSPFLYLLKADQPLRVAAVPAQATLVYPFHSWEGADTRGSHPALAAAIAERESAAARVTVCLYWREYENAAVRQTYEEAGFRVICHGHRDDPQFLARQRHEIEAHDRVVSNRVGTAIWYGAACDRAIEVYGPVLALAQENAKEVRRAQMAAWPALCRTGLPPGDALVCGREELGHRFLRGQDELARLLGWTGFHRRVGPVIAGLATVRRRFKTDPTLPPEQHRTRWTAP